MTVERSLTTGQAARLLGCSPQTVRDWIKEGRIRAEYASGSKWARIPESELAKLGAPDPRAPSAGVGELAHSLATALRNDLRDAVRGALEEGAGETVSAAVRGALRDHEARTVDERRLQERTTAALRRLAAARWWQRRGILRELRASGLLP